MQNTIITHLPTGYADASKNEKKINDRSNSFVMLREPVHTMRSTQMICTITFKVVERRLGKPNN